MTYLSGKAKKKKKIIRYGLYGVLLVFVVLFWATIKSVLSPLVEPIITQYSETKKAISIIPELLNTYATSRENLVKKDKDLLVTIERLENQLAEKDSELREYHGIVANEGTSSISSTLVLYPLMQDATKLYSTIILSKGYKDGVEVGMYVNVRGLQPVCIIKEVNTETAVCLLLSAPGISTEAVTSSSSSPISLTLVGRGGGNFLADVARDTPVAIGDRVFLKSDQSMTLGTVVDVLHNNQDTSWHVFVRGMYNPVTSSIFYIRKK